MGRADCGSSRVNPSKIEVVIRISAMPVATWGSNDSGSILLMMTRSARGSFRTQPVSSRQARAGKRRKLRQVECEIRSPDFLITRRSALQSLKGALVAEFIGG